MRSPIARLTIVGVLLGVATLALVLYSILGSYRFTCEVCVTYRGQTACREASGRTAKAASETAVDNACAFLARGMTASIECSRTPPSVASCRGR